MKTKNIFRILPTLLILCNISCVHSKLGFLANGVEKSNGKEVLIVNSKDDYFRQDYYFNSTDSLLGYWYLKQDSLFFLPLSRKVMKDQCSPFLFAVLRDELVYSPPCELGTNDGLIGLQYPTYVFCERINPKDRSISVTHELHDYDDFETDSIMETWINKRQFVIDHNGISLKMSSTVKSFASLFCYD